MDWMACNRIADVWRRHGGPVEDYGWRENVPSIVICLGYPEAHMQLTPESKSIFESLIAGKLVIGARLPLGPFGNAARLLLRVLLQKYDELRESQGELQAKSLLKAYLEAANAQAGKSNSDLSPKHPGAQDLSQFAEQGRRQTSISPMTVCRMPARWRLHELTCRSIQGVAPFKEEFPFWLGGKSILLYGPNGSGKSSLMRAIVWVLTGLTLTDSPDETEIASIHKITEEPKRGSKICDWPTICTLPEYDDPSCVKPDSMVSLTLNSPDDNTFVKLRRTLDKGLEIQTDGQEWRPCLDLSELGITPLDLQLSILAPTLFGREIIEEAPNSRRILSLMLGYDALEDIGSLADNLGRNRTSLFKKCSEVIANDRDKLHIKLRSLPDIAPRSVPLCKLISTLGPVEKICQDDIKRMRKKVAEEIDSSRASIAKVLGLPDGESTVPRDLEDNLIKAIGYLEQDFSVVCRVFSEIASEVVLPPKHGLSAEAQIAELERDLRRFVQSAQDKIARRLEWWRKETAQASKAEVVKPNETVPSQN